MMKMPPWRNWKKKCTVQGFVLVAHQPIEVMDHPQHEVEFFPLVLYPVKMGY